MWTYLGNPAPNFASGQSSHAEGIGTTASGFAAHAEGGTEDITSLSGPQAMGDFSHAEGISTSASAEAAHAEGSSTQALGPASHAEGTNTIANVQNAHAEGNGTFAFGVNSHAEGSSTNASGFAAHAEGSGSTASGDHSHAEGENTVASQTAAHAEGGGSTASGIASHAEGTNTNAFGISSHAEGNNTDANGDSSHAEGQGTQANGAISHAEGSQTQAQAPFSHSEGLNTIAAQTGSHIMGQNGTTRFPFSWHLANGLAVGPTLNSAVIEGATGNLYLDGVVLSPAAADYAEMFETVDRNPIDVGYFVTFDGAGDKIRKANAADQYILGVVSATPAMIADASDLRWHNLFEKDEWGRIQYHEVVVPEMKNADGTVVQPEFTKTEPILNPEWDASKEYIPRLQRPEWVPVGLLGKLLVRDDGTCQPNGYCKPNNEGLATAADHGYRVMKRTGPNQILVMLNSIPSIKEIDIVEKLENLAKLKVQGFLTDEEFQTQKLKLLSL
ncbi:peptidase G2 autoproteolytic cleavage domain-containing protein [Peribacillus sp. NPDC060253]|uniref:peptidase G2 autoproteolytic cleavage domain-containing protein n=1 Tax=Peribacillus sp. NPDC060253 TaxID=3347084 RepID=UPI0036511581